MFVAALFLGNAARSDAAIDDAEIGIANGSALEGARAKFGAFRGAAAAEILEPEGGVEPGFRRPIESVTDHKPLAVALADHRQKEPGLADMIARGSGGIGQPDQRDPVEVKAGIEQRHLFLQGDLGARSKKLPGGMLGITDGEPAMVDDVLVGGEAIDILRFKIERVLGNEEKRIGAALEFHGAMDEMKCATA